MRPRIREKLERIRELYPPERLNQSKERIRRVWKGEPPLDRLPFVMIPPDFSYYDDVFEPEEGLDRYLDTFIRRGAGRLRSGLLHRLPHGRDAQPLRREGGHAGKRLLLSTAPDRRSFRLGAAGTSHLGSFARENVAGRAV